MFGIRISRYITIGITGLKENLNWNDGIEETYCTGNPLNSGKLTRKPCTKQRNSHGIEKSMRHFYFTVIWLNPQHTNFIHYYSELRIHVHVSHACTHVEKLTRVVTKISSSQGNTTSRRGIKQLGISLGSIFLLYCHESSRGPRS